MTLTVLEKEVDSEINFLFQNKKFHIFAAVEDKKKWDCILGMLIGSGETILVATWDAFSRRRWTL